MGGYVPNTKAQQQQMLKAIGHSSFDDLYQVIPESMRVKSLNLEPGKASWKCVGLWRDLLLKINLLNRFSAGREAMIITFRPS